MPFGKYTSFDKCVADNQDKDSPEGYCSWLHHKITGEWPSEKSMMKGGNVKVKKSQSLEEKLDQIRSVVYHAFESPTIDKEPSNVGIVSTFDSSVIVKDYDTGKLYEIEYKEKDGEIVLGEPVEVEDIYVVKQAMAANPKIALKEIQNLINTWDEWAEGFDECVKALEDQPGVDNPEALFAWLHYQAKGEWPVEKSKDGIELSGPIIGVNKDSKKRIAYAAVLVPGEKDSDGEIVTKEKVEDACHEWMDLYQNIDFKHTLNNVGKPIENFLTYSERVVKTLDGEELTLPEGTWIIGAKLDEETFDAVEKGELKGYSIMGIKRSALKALKEKNIKLALKSLDDKGELQKALKKTLLKDLGEDWVPASVAVTDSPAVPKSKWFATKSKIKKPQSILDRIKSRLSSKPVEKGKNLTKEVKVEKSTRTINIIKGGKNNMEITRKELQRMIGRAVKKEFSAHKQEAEPIVEPGEVVDIVPKVEDVIDELKDIQDTVTETETSAGDEVPIVNEKIATAEADLKEVVTQVEAAVEKQGEEPSVQLEEIIDKVENVGDALGEIKSAVTAADTKAGEEVPAVDTKIEAAVTELETVVTQAEAVVSEVSKDSKKAKKDKVEKVERPKKDKELEALKKKVDVMSTGLDKVCKSLGIVDSKAIKGQDADDEIKPAKKNFGSRDSWGRKVTTKPE